MRELSSLCRIGFGGYRVSIESREHREALCRALSLGCNLIDTAANYMNGGSESLIGQVLEANPGYDAFVVTKGGYAQGESLEVLSKLHRNGQVRDGVIALPDGGSYSIHPDFLAAQIELSARRLRRRQIDAFLLHNPEHALTPGTSREEQLSQIKSAFELLEEKVAEGRIRYYGVSSNTFALPDAVGTATSLSTLLATAEEVSAASHFKLIQFPFNFLEMEAVTPGLGGVSVIDLARAHGILTLSNRPLNALSAAGMVRLATYEIAEVEPLDCAFDDCLALLRARFAALDLADDPMELTVLQVLQAHWQSLANPEAVEQLFRGLFFPLLQQLYPDGIPADEREVYGRLHRAALVGSRATMTRNALAFRRNLIASGVLDEGDEKPLPVVACAHYLRAGIDHVLIGMRSVHYVESLKELF